jgi:hypothetical protein
MKLRGILLLALSLLCDPAVAQETRGTSPLTGQKGGTGNAFMQFAGPSTSIKTYTLPNASDTIATLAAAQTFTNKTLNCANNTCTVRMASDVTGLGTGVATAAAANLSAAGGLASTIASGTAAMGTGAISSATCATVVTATATGVATTDVLTASFNGDPTAVTGYVPLVTGMLTIIAYPTANTANFKVCNNTGASITPGAITLNWRVVR